MAEPNNMFYYDVVLGEICISVTGNEYHVHKMLTGESKFSISLPINEGIHLFECIRERFGIPEVRKLHRFFPYL